MSERPPALDVKSVLQAAFNVRDEDPEYFGLWLQDTYATRSTWHDDQDGNATWNHHASSLGECLRRHILIRSGVEKEPLTVESRTTFEVGHHIHLLLQFGLAVSPDYELLAHEVGGIATSSDGYNLAALADSVFRDLHTGIVAILEVKSEKEYAAKYRKEEAEAAGRTHNAKPDHVLQVRSQAAVIYSQTDLRPTHAAICYWSKDSGTIEVCWVVLDTVPVREAVQRRELAWTDYQLSGHLPERLSDFPGKNLCQPRSKTDPRGKYCPVREACAR